MSFKYNAKSKKTGEIKRGKRKGVGGGDSGRGEREQGDGGGVENGYSSPALLVRLGLRRPLVVGLLQDTVPY